MGGRRGVALCLAGGLVLLAACEQPFPQSEPFETKITSPAVSEAPPYPQAPEQVPGGGLPEPQVIVGTPGIPVGTPAGRVGIPDGALPPPGQCRVWVLGTPAEAQAPAGHCDIAVPPGAVLVGS